MSPPPSSAVPASNGHTTATTPNDLESILGPFPFRVFIGYDPREDAAYKVCHRTLLKHTTIPLSITPIVQPDLRTRNLYWRDRDPTESTAFSFTRFLTPYLAGYTGWAMFVDCDFLYTGDLADLLRLVNPQYAAMCVKHVYEPRETVKMDGAVQTKYPRKNWSSMVLYNCGHPKNVAALTPGAVSSKSGAFLHRFQWLEDEEIGEVPFVWNFLVGHNKVDPQDLDGTYPKAIHYTLGGPWFEQWKGCEFGDVWEKEFEEVQPEEGEEGKAQEGGIQVSKLQGIQSAVATTTVTIAGP